MHFAFPVDVPCHGERLKRGGAIKQGMEEEKGERRERKTIYLTTYETHTPQQETRVNCKNIGLTGPYIQMILYGLKKYFFFK